MKDHITPIVLAAAVGMCMTSRQTSRITLTTRQPIIPAASDELRLPAGTNDLDDTVYRLQTLLLDRGLPDCVDSDINAWSERLHILIDREFLGVLTPNEAKELTILLEWRDNMKADFFLELASEQS